MSGLLLVLAKMVLLDARQLLDVLAAKTVTMPGEGERERGGGGGEADGGNPGDQKLGPVGMVLPCTPMYV